ncbi:P-loop containing nucleoside triphosphate hydrolase protein, partial [Amniculicola lignicola CBS 123094]
MLRQATRACPFCEVRALLGRPSTTQAAHQQTRPYAQIQRERAARYVAGAQPNFRSRSGSDRPRPSRMVLSDNVARPPPRPASDGRPPTARPSRDPFGHLNTTKVPRSLELAKEKTLERKSRVTGRRDGEPTKRRPRHEPYHALKMQKTLHEMPWGMRKSIKKEIEFIESFEDLPLMDTVQAAIKDALPDLEYRIPTPAQRVAIPALLGIETRKTRTRRPQHKSGLESFLLAAETGSGKTLAYLLPVLDAIKREEAADIEQATIDQKEAEEAAAADQRDDIFALESPASTKAVDPARPRAIILVPSAELVNQVGMVAKALSHTVKFRAAPISAKNSPTVIRSRLFNEAGVDVLISTPPLLASIAESNPNILSRVTHLIIDEADSLLDRSFRPSTTSILERCIPSLKKLLLCSATIPKYLDKYLLEQYPNLNRLVTPNLHAIPRRVQLGVIDVNKDPYRGNKLLACADTIWQIGKAASEFAPGEEREDATPTKRILVFVNERDDTEEVAGYLRKKGVDAEAFHRDTDPGRQAKALASFTGNAKAQEKEKDGKDGGKETAMTAAKLASGARRTLPNTKVLVTTDLGSRGIDTVSVKHVILFDVPHTTIDFIHRLGRTGRMGRRGRGIVLVGPGDRADVVKEVRDAMFRGEAL